MTTGELVRAGTARRAMARSMARCGFTLVFACSALACTGPTVGPELDPGAGDSGAATPDTRDATIIPDVDADDGIDTNTPGDADARVDTAEAGDPCIDPTGFGGRGCRTCAPVTQADLENACTPAEYVPFDDGRLGLDGGTLPSLGVDAGTDSAADSAADTSPDAGTDSTVTDSSTTDAGSDTTVSDAGADTADAPPPPPRCSTLSGGNVVYLTGASAVTIFIGYLAQALAASTTPMTVVYVTQGSCNGVGAVLNPATGLLKGTADYWTGDTSITPDAARHSCQLDSAGVAPDIGISDVYATSCFDLPSGLPAGIQNFPGPVQTMAFVVPESSTQRSISSEAAYLVYGFGGASYPVPPWVDLTHLYTRFPTSGPQTMIAAQIGLPADRWLGPVQSGSGPMQSALIAANTAGAVVSEKTIGILSSTYADDFRDTLSILAFKDRGQKVAFFPDLRHDTYDRKNVRDGHYALWGPLNMITHVDGAGRASTNAQRFINVVNGVETLTAVEIVALYAQRHIVPTCAMTVTRDVDGGPIRPFKPAKGCGCYFEEKATGAKPSTCTTCTTNIDCPTAAPNCNKFGGAASGYCEP